MSKLLKLAGGIISVAAGQLHSVLRDLMKNEAGLKIFILGHHDGTTWDGTNFISASPGSNICVATTSVIDGPVTPFSATVLKTGSGGYKCSVSGFPNLDTPEKCAALAYGDSARTTFPSLQDFMVRCLEGPLQTELAGLDIVVLDQIAETVDLMASGSSATAVSELCIFEQDDSSGNQFGE